MRTFEEDLQLAITFHGHLCAGQVLGTRIARLGLKQFHIESPEQYRDLIVFVEADRCLADAVSSICHCTLGRRRLKWMDYGKMAATFYDIQSNKAFRIHNSNRVSPEKGEDVVAFFNQFTDEELFTVQAVEVDIRPEDLPGKPMQSIWCVKCSEKVHDGRHVVQDGQNLCKVCAGISTYYKNL